MSQYLDFISQAMDVSAIARNATANNVANYNTPSYKAVEVNFEKFFEEQGFSMKQTRDKHIDVNGQTGSTGTEGLYQEKTTEERSDGNNVDLNKEMTEMIKNNYRYNMTVTAFNKEAGKIRTALGSQN